MLGLVLQVRAGFDQPDKRTCYGTDFNKYYYCYYYFPPGSDAALLVSRFNLLENETDATKYRLQLYRDFNLPKVDCIYNHNNINDFAQHNMFASCSGNIRDLVVPNIPTLEVARVDNPVVTPDSYHPPLTVSFTMFLRSKALSGALWYVHSAGDYFILYKCFKQYNWTDILQRPDVDSMGNSFTAVVNDDMNLFAPECTNRPESTLSGFSKIYDIT